MGFKQVISSFTERKSNLMKRLSKLFHNGASAGGIATGGQQPKFQRDENMVCHAPVRSLLGDRTRANKEKEELDRALALSLAEDFERAIGDRRRTNNDENLAWVRGDDFNSVPYTPDVPRHRRRTNNDENLAWARGDDFNSVPYAPYVPREYYPRGYRICGGCKREIGFRNYLECMGTFYHPECFCCHACGYPITEHEFSVSGSNTYHKSCFNKLTHPKCEVCHQFIPTTGFGLIEYRCHPFWSQKYCPSHEHDNTARCCSCERLESRNATYISLGDGRSLCLECMESAIMDTGDCQPLYHAIRDYYEGMNMRIKQQIPMLLVERQALNEAVEGEKHGFHHMPETRGLCLSEEQTVTSILRRPRMERHGLVGIRTQPQKLVRRCEVTAILVLYGLPRLLTGAILAHELMHGWLRLNDFRELRPDVEEGICQVLSHMWLESEVIPISRNMPSSSTHSWSSSKKGGKSPIEKKLGEFFMHQIVHDASPAYGDGYRAAMAAVNKYGLRCTLDHIRFTGTFPE